VTHVLVIGAGSIGVRHATNLIAAGVQVDITDVSPDRARAVPGACAVPFDADSLARYDGVVVASPTSMHLEHALLAAEHDRPSLVEKPIALRAEDAASLADVNDRVMVGYNLRLHEPLERLMDLVHGGAIGTIVGARLWFGQWLPDWRPSVDYRSTYSARSALGGGVLLDAIHELDLLVWLAGDDDFAVRGGFVGRIGPLDIDVEDTVRALLVHRDGWPVEIALDYLSRRYRRGIEVIGDRATVRFDWADSTLDLEDSTGRETTTFDVPVSASYEREAGRFVDLIEQRTAPPVDARTGLASLRLAGRIRDAAT